MRAEFNNFRPNKTDSTVQIDATFKTHNVYPLKRNEIHDWALVRLLVGNPMTCHVTSPFRLKS